MHLMTGHLSHQIEHHLFPTIPAWRYPEMAVEVQAIAKKYGVPYTTGPFARQIGKVIKRIARLSLPLSLDDALNWRKNAKAVASMKTEGHEVLKGKRRLGATTPEGGKPRAATTSGSVQKLASALKRVASVQSTAA